MKRLKLIKRFAMRVTLKYIMKHKNKRGAWTAKQLKAIGVSWPPKKGWKKRSVGFEITPEQQVIFEGREAVKTEPVKTKRIRSPESKMRSFLRKNPDDPRVLKARELSANGPLGVFAALALYVDVRELK